MLWQQHQQCPGRAQGQQQLPPERQLCCSARAKPQRNNNVRSLWNPAASGKWTLQWQNQKSTRKKGKLRLISQLACTVHRNTSSRVLSGPRLQVQQQQILSSKLSCFAFCNFMLLLCLQWQTTLNSISSLKSTICSSKLGTKFNSKNFFEKLLQHHSYWFIK